MGAHQMSYGKDDMDWLKIIGIVLVFFVIMLVVAGCQKFVKDKSFESSCSATCKDCKDLKLACDHIQVDDQGYTVNHPPEQQEEDN